MRVVTALSCALLCFFHTPIAQAQETVCARVKIEIKQELTLERQAFDAEMKIHNTTDSGVISNVSVVVKVFDEAGTPIQITSDANNLSAKFFVRISGKQNISDVDGTGTVSPATTSTINWLIIPAPGSAGTSPLGKKYLVGATLKYTFGGEEQTLDVSPDVITVKPLPLLTLDYFLTQDVWADDPLTPEIEAIEPFTLGVRVKNNGFATAKNLKIDSAQPKIIENNQGLLIGFKLDGSYVNDAPAQNTLLINFGDIAPTTSKMGRWIMETTLAGRFTEFSAKFTHADELGGSLTSLLQATNAHLLIHDVRVDLPGRDFVRDFLAQDGDVIRLYESDGPDTLVTDRSSAAQLTASTSTDGNARYNLVFPPTDGFSYVKRPDPFNGTKALGTIIRSDAKVMLPENVWLSKSRNAQTKQLEHWIHFFDVNSTGVYAAEFQAPPTASLPPQIQFIPDRTVQEEQQVSFLVEASSPSGKPITLSAASLPAGASLTQQAPDPQAPTLTRAIFDWTPAKGAAGNYLIVITASDGTLSSTRTASIKVTSLTPPPGPGTPTLSTPASGTQVTSLKPTLTVLTSGIAQDPAVKIQFELYADEAMTQQVGSALQDKTSSGTAAQQPVAWLVPTELTDNTAYWWRARSFDGNQTYSAWVNGRFFVNTYNDPPDSFNLTSPIPNAIVASLTPTLAWTNSHDKEGDAITYSVAVYKNAALTELVASISDLPEGVGGTTSWTVGSTTAGLPLTNLDKYYWQVTAKDSLGAPTTTAARPFTVNIASGNTAPSAPVIVSPIIGGQSTTASLALTIQNSVDAEADLLTYVFELDTVNTFDSGDKRTSGQVIQSASATTSWTVDNLIENKHYYWRVKAQDGQAESSWVGGDFLMNATNDAPPAPTIKNPGNAAWVATQQPTLEANPVQDPEGSAVRYQFEVFKDAGLSNKAAEGIAPSPNFLVPTPLTDKTTHWWRVRALDEQGATSAWSAPAILYISTAPYQDPTIQVTAPTQPTQPSTVNGRKQTTINWEGTDPNIDATIALYTSTSPSGYAGELIVDGLHQQAGAQTGSYTWDVTDLAPGAYYVYAIIYDAKGLAKAYAPGPVVIANTTQTGKVLLAPVDGTYTEEWQGERAVPDYYGAAFNVRLASAPSAEVTVPLVFTNPRKVATPRSVTFTPQNWSVNQQISVSTRDDCQPDPNSFYRALAGGAISLDPNYIGVSGPTLLLSKWMWGNMASTDNANFSVCHLTVVEERELEGNVWEYRLKGDLTNIGTNVAGVTATLQPFTTSGGPLQIVEGALSFGAVNQSETSHTNDTITLRFTSRVGLNPPWANGYGYQWRITATQ